MTVRAVIQARMGSTRLPGKIMAPLGGQPLLWHVVRRLEAGLRSPSPGTPGEGRGEGSSCGSQPPHPRPLPREPGRGSRVQVATTAQPADDLTADWCRRQGIACFRGDDNDVLARYLAAVEDLGDNDTLLRATADNPLYCPRRTAAILGEHRRHVADYTCIRNLSYVVPEVIRVGALREMAARTDDPYCCEHVTPYFRQRPTEFRTLQLPVDWCGLRPELRLTVDTAAELEQMQGIFEACSAGKGKTLFSLEAAYVAYDKQSSISAAAA